MLILKIKKIFNIDLKMRLQYTYEDIYSPNASLLHNYISQSSLQTLYLNIYDY